VWLFCGVSGVLAILQLMEAASCTEAGGAVCHQSSCSLGFKARITLGERNRVMMLMTTSTPGVAITLCSWLVAVGLMLLGPCFC